MDNQAWIRDFVAVGAPFFVWVKEQFGPDVGVFVYCLLFTFMVLPCVVTIMVWKTSTNSVPEVGVILFCFWVFVLFCRISLATEGQLSSWTLRLCGILIIVLDWLLIICLMIFVFYALKYEGKLLVYTRERIGIVSISLLSAMGVTFMSLRGKLFKFEWGNEQWPFFYSAPTDENNARLLDTLWEHLKVEWSNVLRPSFYSSPADENSARLLDTFWEHLKDNADLDSSDLENPLLRQNLIRGLQALELNPDPSHVLREVLALPDGADVQMTNDPLSCAVLAFWLLREQDPVIVLLTRGGEVPVINMNEDIGTQLEDLSSFELLALYISRLLGQRNYQFVRTGFFRGSNPVVSYTMAEYAVASKILGFCPLLGNVVDQRAIYVGSIRKELVTGFSGSPPYAVISRRAKFGLVVAVGVQLLTMWAARTQNDDTIVGTVVCIMLGNSIAAVAETSRSHTEHVLTCYEYLWFICCLGGRCYPSCRGTMRDRHIVGAGIFFARLFHMVNFFSVLFPPEVAIVNAIAILFLTAVPSLLGHLGPPGVLRRLDITERL
jgi:hypothetical protein